MQKIHCEAGQIIHNNPVGVPCPEYVEALCAYIRKEIGRVYWNVNQRWWAETASDDDSPSGDYLPLPPGIEWRPYYNWGGSPDDPDWDQAQADAPNFSFDGVELRWYKHFGRSMNVNVEWPPDKWVAWFDRCLRVIRSYEEGRDAADNQQPGN